MLIKVYLIGTLHQIVRALSFGALWLRLGKSKCRSEFLGILENLLTFVSDVDIWGDVGSRLGRSVPCKHLYVSREKEGNINGSLM